ncbi:NAD(P)-binding protein [Coniochaeta ligniaria NRRL 30616]|uniref:NAD(P)-binding protein n=1 Tax=Coniochaeta ligniaria NRRL 30616 TaxID=1408157 RepID=A0A1J7IUP9_9PEZI|nr:NAD(P)-binding protein [Coniochaeta ligniaria NRRL 30616]
MGTTWSQFFPPDPTFTETNLPSQKGKVFLITGGGSGIGLELAKILYGAGGNVFITSRSESKAKLAIESIRASAASNETAGQVDFVVLDYADLTSVKASAEQVLEKCGARSDVLWNNAGISLGAPHGSKSAQGYDLITSTNCLGPLLFTRSVLPALTASASDAAPGSVRVVWTASFSVDGETPKGGFKMEDVKKPKGRDATYAITKTGNWFLASELGKELAPKGILSVAQSPGNLNTPLLKDLEWWRSWARLLLYPPKLGAYTELYAGLSDNLSMEDVGGFVIPWGRKHPAPRGDLLKCMKTKDEGGTGLAKEFVDWCEEQIGPFLRA